MLSLFLMRAVALVLAVTLALELVAMAIGTGGFLRGLGAALWVFGFVLAVWPAGVLVRRALPFAAPKPGAPVIPLLAYAGLATAGALVLGTLVVDGSRLIPSYEYGGREKAYVSSMKSDLRNLYDAQAQAFARSGAFTTEATTLFRPSAGVIGPSITLTSDGWTATVSHAQSAVTCAVYAGSMPVPPARVPGEPACNPSRLRDRPNYRLVEYLAIGALLGLTLLALRVGRPAQ